MDLSEELKRAKKEIQDLTYAVAKCGEEKMRLRNLAKETVDINEKLSRRLTWYINTEKSLETIVW